MGLKRLNIMKIKTDKRGFTLIELLVTISVIGILAAILIPSMPGFIEKAKEGADKADVRNLNSVTSAYRSEEPPHDVFKDINKSDDELMDFLIDQKMLSQKLEARSEGAEFKWNFDQGKWTLASSENPVNLGQVTFVETGGQKGYIKGSYSGEFLDILIPQMLKGIPVTNIGQDVFKEKNLTSLIFDKNSNVTRIHARAFENNDLTEVALPNSLKNIDHRAFLGNNITKITIGAGVVIEDRVFQNDNKFRTAYNANGAGTYTLVNGSWIKQ